jgi:anti-anti-sigma factor
MNLEWTKTADWHVARFIHQNLNDCDAESRAINSFIESLPTGSKVAISFRGIEWVSSRVLGLIMAAKTAVAKRNGQFAITSPSEKIMEVLKITKLHKVLTIKKSTSELG